LKAGLKKMLFGTKSSLSKGMSRASKKAGLAKTGNF
jgi:hypothetical protein